MGLVDPDHKPLSDDDMREQLETCLKWFASGDCITSEGGIPLGRNGPFIELKLPIREVAELALAGLKAKQTTRPEALAFQEAVWLLEVCRSCDLVYDGPWGPTGPDVHVIVDAFLKKHKSVIDGYAPKCPESPRGQKI